MRIFLVVPALMLAGCGTTVTPAAGPVSGSGPAPASSAAPASGAAPASSAAAAPAQQAGVRCTKAGGLTVALGGEEGGAGHRRAVLTFTNTSGAACRLTGYPGVAALDAGGRQLAQARRTDHGYMSGSTPVTTVTLPAGGVAQAVVEGLGATPDGAACHSVAGLLVTAPDDTGQARLDWRTDTCPDLEVHPVTAGSR